VKLTSLGKEEKQSVSCDAEAVMSETQGGEAWGRERETGEGGAALLMRTSRGARKTFFQRLPGPVRRKRTHCQ